MNTESDSVKCDMPSQVDRLVCGELDESARQTLLAWLEADPVRWRLCGVAFLEAQAWSRALQGEPHFNAHAAAVERASGGLVPAKSPTSRRTLIRKTAIATAVVVAFGLGLAFRDFSAPVQHAGETAAGSGAPGATDPALTASSSSLPSKQEPILASFNVETGGSGRLTPIQIPVVPAATEAGRERDHSEISEYERQQWERRGFKVSLERRFMFARLADGRQVVVPVEQVRVNPIPIHIN